MRIRSLELVLILFAAAALALAQTPPGARAQAQKPKDSVASAPADALPAGTLTILQTRAQEYLRKLYGWGSEFGVKAGDVKPTAIPDLYEISIDVSLNGQSDSAVVYITKDGRYMVRGELLNMSTDPFAEITKKLTLDGWPSTGPKDAPVVVVEFGDFQCPSCRQLDLVLRQLLPEFPNVLFVFKDFPLEQIHPWAMTAALVGRCAYKQNADAFWKLHDMIYDNQDGITAETAYDKLSEFAIGAGLDKEGLGTCFRDPQTLESIRHSMAEGQSVGVNGTPTTFVNGRTVSGPNEPILRQYIKYYNK
jgi:protein-disulfide isomerase